MQCKVLEAHGLRIIDALKKRRALDVVPQKQPTRMPSGASLSATGRRRASSGILCPKFLFVLCGPTVFFLISNDILDTLYGMHVT